MSGFMFSVSTLFFYLDICISVTSNIFFDVDVELELELELVYPPFSLLCCLFCTT